MAQEEVRIIRIMGKFASAWPHYALSHTLWFNKGSVCVWGGDVLTEERIKKKEAVFWPEDLCSKCCLL